MVLPEIKLHIEELKVIESVIHGYGPYLVRRHTQEALHKFQVLSEIRNKVLPLLRPGALQEGYVIPLTTEEIETLGEATEGFAQLIPLVAPPSKERDEIIASLRILS